MTSRKEERMDEEITSDLSPENQQREIREAIVDAFNEAKDNTQRIVKESKKEIPSFTKAVNEYQEKTFEAAREIAESNIDSQKEIINLFQQSAWISRLRENTYKILWPNWISSKSISEPYTKMISFYIDNMINEVRLSNNMLSTSMEVYKSSTQQLKNNVNVFSRIAVDNAKTFEKAMKRFNELQPRGSTEKGIHKPQQ
jgi:methyl-accepting chemotaxis protein